MELWAGNSERTQAFRETETGTLLSSSRNRPKEISTSQTGFACCSSQHETRNGNCNFNLPQTDALRLWLRNYIVIVEHWNFVSDYNREFQWWNSDFSLSQSCFIFLSMALVAYFLHPTCCVGQRAWSWQSSGRVIWFLFSWRDSRYISRHDGNSTTSLAIIWDIFFEPDGTLTPTSCNSGQS